jgi:hypothetical protein
VTELHAKNVAQGVIALTMRQPRGKEQEHSVATTVCFR